MKLVLCWANLFLASWALADSASDRAAIESVVSALNDHSKSPSSLFTADAAGDSAEIARLSSLDRMLSPSEEPLSEMSAPNRLFSCRVFKVSATPMIMNVTCIRAAPA